MRENYHHNQIKSFEKKKYCRVRREDGTFNSNMDLTSKPSRIALFSQKFIGKKKREKWITENGIDWIWSRLLKINLCFAILDLHRCLTECEPSNLIRSELSITRQETTELQHSLKSIFQCFEVHFFSNLDRLRLLKKMNLTFFTAKCETLNEKRFCDE